MELLKYAFNIDSDAKKDGVEMKRIGTALMVALILASVFVAPVMAMGPKKSQGKKAIHLDRYTIIVSNRGWRQWRTDIDRFAIVFFTEGMTEQAIQSHLDAGWSGPVTIGTGDPRYPYVSPYVDGPVEIIWKWHDIPAE